MFRWLSVVLCQICGSDAYKNATGCTIRLHSQCIGQQLAVRNSGFDCKEHYFFSVHCVLRRLWFPPKNISTVFAPGS